MNNFLGGCWIAGGDFEKTITKRLGFPPWVMLQKAKNLRHSGYFALHSEHTASTCGLL